MLPQAFGLDRHRLRLKAGASEKLRLSFLPFYMPAAPTPSASPTKGRKGKAAQQAPESPPVVRSLLVLKDSDCGEFTYELCGEVAQPGPFLQHDAKVGLDGGQVRAGYASFYLHVVLFTWLLLIVDAGASHRTVSLYTRLLSSGDWRACCVDL